MRTKSLLFVVLFNLGFCAFAQFEGRHFALGPSITSYKGDLSGYEKVSGGIELSLIPTKDKKVIGHLNVLGGSAVAQTLTDVHTNPLYTPKNFLLVKYIGANYTFNYYIIKKEHLKVFVGLGLGIMQFTPYDELNNNLTEVSEASYNTRLADEDFVGICLLRPIQAGAIYTFKNDFGFMLNFKWLNTNTDYLDNMSRLANPNNNDNIAMLNLSFLVPIRNSAK